MSKPRTPRLSDSIRRVLAAATVLSLASGTVAAQEAAPTPAAEELEGIVVTGSRIRTPGAVSNSPIATLGAEELALQGVANIEDSLRSLPQVVPGRTAYGSTADGLTTVDLRGLGETRTMVLVDGTRWIPTGTEGVVDLNTIPTALVERVEVVTGGASAVYGSDAMAGVVNFILKDDFEGAEISVNYRATDSGDGNTLDVSTLLGGNFAEGRGNAVVWMNYTDRDEIFQDARGYSA
jgi:outer membrane receptor protein involved in Fe transport